MKAIIIVMVAKSCLKTENNENKIKRKNTVEIFQGCIE